MREIKDSISKTNKAGEFVSKKSFTRFLIESDIKTLNLVGKSIQFFGLKVTMSFFLGAASLYGYELFAGHFPVIKTAPPETKEIEISGRVLTLDKEPLKEGFRIIALDCEKGESGPFQHDDGTFQVMARLNQNRQYRFLVLTEDNQVLMLSPVFDVVESRRKFQLSSDIIVPTGLGRVGGRIMDQYGKPFAGYVKVDGSFFRRIGDDGSYFVKDIPLGKVEIQVAKDLNPRSVLHKSDLQLRYGGIMSKDITVGLKK